MLLLLLTAAMAQAPPNLVLITMDTTRADAIGIYGQQLPGLLEARAGVTPNIDALAQAGVRFEQFFAHAPTTLNSHTSLFTGRDPHEHAVPKNGYPVPEGMDSLALRLEREGWDTLAVVAARALEQEMGLSRGFRVYDDQMSLQLGPMYQDLAEGVVARTLAAVDAREVDKPLFLWVHFYDPHGPYSAPGEWFGRFQRDGYDGRYANPDAPVLLRGAVREGEVNPDDVDQIAARYLGEVHYMDHHIGRLISGLTERGLLDHAVVVLTADHGETLSEVPEYAWSHGAGVDAGVLHVPLIVRGYGVPVAAGVAVQSQADMSGLASTVEALVGLTPSLSPHRSFVHLVRPGPVWDVDGWPSRPTRITFAEATRARDEPDDAWNNAHLPRGVRVADLVLDVDEGVALLRPGLARALPNNAPFGRSLLEDLLKNWDRAAPPHRDRAMSAETVDALRALGYIDAPSEDPGDDSRSTPP